jgi:valyl-tRNA synthetase
MHVSKGGALEHRSLVRSELPPEDRWLLSRLSQVAGAVTAGLVAYNPSQALAAAREFFWGDLCDWYIELVKPRLEDEVKAPVCRQLLAAALDQTLRLLHPSLPFITEELWRHLGAMAPVRGVDMAFTGVTPLLVHASWPTWRPEWEDKDLELEFDRMRRATSAVRDLRASYTIPRSKKLDAAIRVSGDGLESLRRLQHHIAPLADLSSLVIDAQVARPRNAATKVDGDLEVFLADVLDPVKEKARLEKQREQVTKQLGAIQKKLGNAAFVDKAPPEVVAAEKGRQAELEGQARALEESIRALG